MYTNINMHTCILYHICTHVYSWCQLAHLVNLTKPSTMPMPDLDKLRYVQVHVVRLEEKDVEIHWNPNCLNMPSTLRSVCFGLPSEVWEDRHQEILAPEYTPLEYFCISEIIWKYRKIPWNTRKKQKLKQKGGWLALIRTKTSQTFPCLAFKSLHPTTIRSMAPTSDPT